MIYLITPITILLIYLITPVAMTIFYLPFHLIGGKDAIKDLFAGLRPIYRLKNVMYAGILSCLVSVAIFAFSVVKVIIIG